MLKDSRDERPVYLSNERQSYFDNLIFCIMVLFTLVINRAELNILKHSNFRDTNLPSRVTLNDLLTFEYLTEGMLKPVAGLRSMVDVL